MNKRIARTVCAAVTIGSIVITSCGGRIASNAVGDAPYSACVDHHFDDGSASPWGCVSAVWEAIQITARCDLMVDSVEIDGTSGEYAVLADANGSPGEVLWQASMEPGPTRLAVFNVAAPFAIRASAPYWIASRGERTCYRYDAAPLGYATGSFGETWEGPTYLAGVVFPFRLRGR